MPRENSRQHLPSDLARQMWQVAQWRVSRHNVKLHQGTGLMTDQHYEKPTSRDIPLPDIRQPEYCRDKGVGVSMTFGQMMQFIRTEFPGNDQRNGSILKALLKRWGERDVEHMIRGAARLGWKDLRALYSKEDVGRKIALAAYYGEQKRAPIAESVRSIFKGWGK